MESRFQLPLRESWRWRADEEEEEGPPLIKVEGFMMKVFS